MNLLSCMHHLILLRAPCDRETLRAPAWMRGYKAHGHGILAPARAKIDRECAGREDRRSATNPLRTGWPIQRQSSECPCDPMHGGDIMTAIPARPMARTIKAPRDTAAGCRE